jgi:hypothetical protein
MKHEGEITDFPRHYITYVKKLDPVNATTAGYEKPISLEPTADLVDVLSGSGQKSAFICVHRRLMNCFGELSR